MKRLVILILLLATTFTGISQKNKVQPSISITNMGMIDFTFTNICDLTNVGIGVNVNLNKGRLALYGAYGFLAELPIWTHGPLVKNHFLGLSLEYSIFGDEKKVRPFIGLSLLSEIATNYRNGYMDESFLSSDDPVAGYGTVPMGSHGSGPYKIGYNTNFYYSTPFLGSLLVGCDIHLAKGLRLSIAAGYGLRIMRYRNVVWTVESDTPYLTEEVNVEELLKDKIVQNKAFHFMEFQLGLSYTFSFNKKEKAQP